MHEFDAAIDAAWPSAERFVIGGWPVRVGDGVTKRANSALVSGEPSPAAIATTIGDIEALYRSRHLPSQFLISAASAPSAVATELSSLGYRSSGHTTVVVGMNTSMVLTSDERVTMTSRLEPAWLAAYRRCNEMGEALPDAYAQHLLRSIHECTYLTAHDHVGTVIGVAQLVVAPHWGCIQCLAVLPSARRMGVGAALVRSALAEVDGSRHTVAAVETQNVASMDLFTSFGFEPSHHYYYMTKPTS